MAELPKNIRKVGGEMVAARSPFTRRVLLPAEADLCNALGLTEEEYYQFLEGVAAKIKERPEAYGLVPEIFAGPGAGALALWKTAAAGGGLTLLGQVAVGVALSVVAYLLTPKPPSMKQGTNERTADMAGLKRFAPQFSFNSVQELANLGDVIPLVFTNTSENSSGGVRVNSQLMWSQLVSLGRFQQLKILALFSLGEIAQKPDYEGYAIGDLLIENYQADKIYLSRNFVLSGSGLNIPFQTNGGAFSDDIFKIDNLKHFSGARNPTTQATFGLSNPMPNLTYFRLPYELVRAPSNLNKDNRPAARITYEKRRKNLAKWPVRAGFVDGGNSSQKAGISDLPVDTYLTYQVVGGKLTDPAAYQQDEDYYKAHGVEDVNSISKAIRESTDSYIVEGEQYLAGTALVSCTWVANEDWPGQPWEAGENSFTRGYQLKVLEKGKYECAPTPSINTHCLNPKWKDGREGRATGDFFQVKDSKYYYEQYDGDAYLLYEPAQRYVLQKVNLGTVSDNRNCHITEIGLKSKVFKQMSFANVNSKPSEDQLDTIYNDRSTLTLGNVNKYIVRYSFFKLQIREAGTGNNWHTLSPSIGNHLGLFCVRGNTPEFQYNYIRIDHPYKQYEYRFFPWPGNDVIKEVIANTTVYVNLLNANGATDSDAISTFFDGSYTVKFAGIKEYSLTQAKLSNTEWSLGEESKARRSIPSSVTELKGISNYSFPSHITAANLPQKRVSKVLWTKLFWKANNTKSACNPFNVASDRHDTVFIGFKNFPKTGFTTFQLYIDKENVTANIQGYGVNSGLWPEEKVPQTSSVNLVDAHGGGKTVSGVEFHYATEDGRGGKFIPIVDPNLTNADTDGYPCGHKDVSMWGDVSQTYYYVRKIEDEWENVSPVIKDRVVTTSNIRTYEDEDGNTITESIAEGSGLQVLLNVWANTARTEVYAEWSLNGSRGQNYIAGDRVRIPAQVDPDNANNTILDEQIRDVVVSDVSEKSIELELNLFDAAADYWKFEGDQSSHLQGPEHQITYCNEIVKTEGSGSLGNPATYSDLAYAGLRINSSKEWTNFSQFSAFFKQGIKVKKLVPTIYGTGQSYKEATSLFPEIAYTLLTDEKIGAGTVINESSVNETNMTDAAKFCKANNLFWDGVISNKINLREFIFEQATYCLLDFTIIGGQFSLYPAIPFDPNTFEIAFDGIHSKPKIKALFTDGNIKDLNVAFLSPEDRQTFQANIIYRKEKINGFSEKKSLIVRLLGADYTNDPLETFDLSGFCTSPTHAMMFGKYVLSNRDKVDHTITFKTAPHYINGVKPGDYIRVFSTTQHVNRFNNGAILEDGSVVSKDAISGNKTFYWWNTSQSVVQEATANFSYSLPATYRGSLFTIKESQASDQCYKVESITFGEDGLIELSGSYSPLTSDGRLAILQGWNDGSRFVVES
tara:strand:- start:9367 stop:13629 length:4263 start_codon:yes stop_codon:yes gene_type:complete